MTIVPEAREQLLIAARQLSDVDAAPQPRRRRFALKLAPVGIAVAIGAGGVAVASGVLSSALGESDRLTKAPVLSRTAPGAPAAVGTELERLAAEVQAGLPYPPGMRDTYDWSRYPGGATLGTDVETRREVQLMSEFRANCLWQRYWLASDASGDAEGLAAATKILAQAPNWPAARTVSGGGVLDRVAELATRGDAAALTANVDAACRNVK